MDRKISGFFQDEDSYWVANLECGHKQHVRHNLPMISRPWVNSELGRQEHLGTWLKCKICKTESQS